ncbi:hypothetical protein [Sphingobacterium siyangense]|uniref:hypothetical protein n=1 Tax=Sphingobacterium siyangense TaxID=459529 RepID=UPI003DA26A72
MFSPIDLIGLFSKSYTIDQTREDFDEFEEIYTLTSCIIPSERESRVIFSSLPKSDSATVRITFEGAEALIFTIDTDFAKFESDMDVAIRGNQGKEIRFKTNIKKKIVDKCIWIYSLKEFENYLNGFKVLDLLDFMSKTIDANGGIVVQSGDIITESWSSSIGFVGTIWDGQNKFSLDQAGRQLRLKSLQSSTHAVSLSEKKLVPDDFLFNAQLFKGLTAIFNKLNLSMIIMAIFDQTTIEGDLLNFKLNGYKGISGSVDLKKINYEECLEEYGKIYRWISQSSNFNDKLGLARNIISLHLNPSNDLSFSGSMYNSILSAYKVYEKQNIKQYIEIRNKLSDQLIDYNKRANAIVEGFASTFQKSALSVLTLFSSIVAIKLLGSSSPSNNFVIYGSIFSFIILFISLAYMIIARYDTFSQRDRYKSSYLNFKERYTDLLNEGDIQRILNNDKEFNEDIQFIRKKIRNYTYLWIIVLVLIFIVVIYYLINETMTEINAVMFNYPNI